MNYYPHHIGDFDKATRHLTRIERSVYLDLLFVYYETETRLALDVATLARKILARSDEERTAVEQVLNEFFIKTETGWVHMRCEDEIEAYRANTSQKSLAGKASAAKRATKKQQLLSGCSTIVESLVQQTNNGTPTNQEPITNNHKPIKKQKHIRASRFDALAHLISENVHDYLALDWLKLRKEKRMTPTKTAIDGIKREADNCGKSLADVIRICCERGWGGFKHEWLERDVPQLQNKHARAGPSAFPSKAASAIMQLEDLKNANRTMVYSDSSGGDAADVLPRLAVTATA